MKKNCLLNISVFFLIFSQGFCQSDNCPEIVKIENDRFTKIRTVNTVMHFQNNWHTLEITFNSISNVEAISVFGSLYGLIDPNNWKEKI